MFDVQGITIQAPPQQVFSYIADAAKLPLWTNAFSSVGNGKAMLQTPNGKVEISLDVQASEQHGTVDWLMTFPDGSNAMAYSRVMQLDPQRSAYTFVLTPPPVPLEMLEGALEEQSRTLAQELNKLKSLLENRA